MLIIKLLKGDGCRLLFMMVSYSMWILYLILILPHSNFMGMKKDNKSGLVFKLSAFIENIRF